MKQIYSVSDAARYLGVFQLTLRNWTDKKLIKSFRTRGGHRRFKIEELDKIMYEAEGKVTLEKLRTIKELKKRLAEAETEIETLKREIEEGGVSGHK